MAWKDAGGETSIRKNAMELVPLSTGTLSSEEDDDINDEALRITTTTNSEEHYYSFNQKTHSSWQRLGVVAGAAILLMLLLVVMGTGATWFVLGTRRSFTGRTTQATAAATVEHPASKAPTVAFCGNSMLYYNDCPRLVEIMLQEMYSSEAALQESCLRGGANLASLWEEGNGMESRFTSRHNNTNVGTPTVSWLLQHPPSRENDSSWDFIVLQDSEILVTNDQERPISMQALREHYLPAISQSTIVLFLQTFSYESPRLRETIHWGDMPAMTHAIERGNQVYAELARDDFGIQSQSIPMATAVQKLAQSNNPDENGLWELIYHHDGVHPSPYGTFLQACLIVSMLTGRPPPLLGDIQGKWQNHARHWATARNRNAESALPSWKEAETLREWACHIIFLSSCPPQPNNDTVN